MENPLLIDERKFTFKAYVLVLNSKPLICLYQPGFIVMAQKKFNLQKTKGGKATKAIHFPGLPLDGPLGSSKGKKKSSKHRQAQKQQQLQEQLESLT